MHSCFLVNDRKCDSLSSPSALRCQHDRSAPQYVSEWPRRRPAKQNNPSLCFSTLAYSVCSKVTHIAHICNTQHKRKHHAILRTLAGSTIRVLLSGLVQNAATFTNSHRRATWMKASNRNAFDIHTQPETRDPQWCEYVCTLAGILYRPAAVVVRRYGASCAGLCI